MNDNQTTTRSGFSTSNRASDTPSLQKQNVQHKWVIGLLVAAIALFFISAVLAYRSWADLGLAPKQHLGAPSAYADGSSTSATGNIYQDLASSQGTGQAASDPGSQSGSASSQGNIQDDDQGVYTLSSTTNATSSSVTSGNGSDNGSVSGNTGANGNGDTAVSAGTCDASDLDGSATWQDSGGAVYGILTINNRGKSDCTLSGYPTIELIAGDNTLATTQANVGSAGNLIDLQAGGQATLHFNWTNWCSANNGSSMQVKIIFSPDKGYLQLPVISQAGYPETDTPSCVNSSSASLVSVSTYAPAN